MGSRKSYYVFILKAALVLLSLWVIHRQVVVKDDFVDTLRQYARLLDARATWATLALLLAMMAGNWLLEAHKWKFLMQPVRMISTAHAIAAILTGITISFFTPNRIGEYGGRVLYLESKYRIKAVLSTLVGSMNQLLVTVVAGSLALVFVLKQSLAGYGPIYVAVVTLLLAGVVLLCGAYFNMAALYRWWRSMPRLQRFEKYIRVFSHFHRVELARVSMLSVLRYLVFTLQFVVLLHLFGIPVANAAVYRQIALVFLILAVVPTFALTELTVRGSVALYCLAPLAEHPAGIVAASFSLWFINLVLPAVAGAFCLLFIRWGNVQPPFDDPR